MKLVLNLMVLCLKKEGGPKNINILYAIIVTSH